MSVANPLPADSRQTIVPAEVAIVVFARAPRPGRCKTRLAAAVGARRAARIYHALLSRAVAAASETAADHVYLACAPDTRDARLHALAHRHGATRLRQPDGDLGERMHAAARHVLRRHAAVVLLGSDQPILDDGWFSDAVATLQRPGRAWLAPTCDGGYWALGLRHAEARPFRGPAWSTSRVAAQTEQRLRRCGWAVDRYPQRRDIDHGRDWQRLSGPTKHLLARRAVRPRAEEVSRRRSNPRRCQRAPGERC